MNWKKGRNFESLGFHMAVYFKINIHRVESYILDAIGFMEHCPILLFIKDWWVKAKSHWLYEWQMHSFEKFRKYNLELFETVISKICLNIHGTDYQHPGSWMFSFKLFGNEGVVLLVMQNCKWRRSLPFLSPGKTQY